MNINDDEAMGIADDGEASKNGRFSLTGAFSFLRRRKETPEPAHNDDEEVHDGPVITVKDSGLVLPQDYFDPSLCNLNKTNYRKLVKITAQSKKYPGAIVHFQGAEASMKTNMAYALLAHHEYDEVNVMSLGDFMNDQGQFMIDQLRYMLESDLHDHRPFILKDCEMMFQEGGHILKQHVMAVLDSQERSTPIFLISDIDHPKELFTFERGVGYDVKFDTLDNDHIQGSVEMIFGMDEAPLTTKALRGEDYTMGLLHRVKELADRTEATSDADIAKLVAREIDVAGTHRQRFSRRIGFKID